jgi:hypothetical protein
VRPAEGKLEIDRTKDMRVPAFSDAEAEFNQAWDAPHNTRFELPAIDVNRVLRDRYTLTRPYRMTRTALWDMEVKKAWDPFTYIPYVVSEARSWGRHTLPDGSEHFLRASQQAAWIEETRGQVLEEVFIDHDQRRIFFMGRAEFPGEPFRAGDHQPLFHVEHAAGGGESAPLNMWRIVFLTAQEDKRLQEPFRHMVAQGLLPGFVEIYIARDQGVDLQRVHPFRPNG